MKPLPETLVLASLCLVDGLYTLWLVTNGLAVEANPLLAWTLDVGVWCFVLAKLSSFLLPLAVLERLRCRSFVRLGLRWGAAAYVLVWCVGVGVMR